MAKEIGPKEAALRAMREARQTRTAPAAKPAKAPDREALCGHQAIGGKRCIRPAEHPEKSHRYLKD